MVDTSKISLSQDAVKIGQSLSAGVLLEASCGLAPGLVSPFSMGSHKDMNFLSFMLGSSVISQYLPIFAQMGIDWDGRTDLLKDLRKLGIIAEKQLLEITNNVNTQRGILFLSAIVAAASGKLIKAGEIKINKVSDVVSEICKGIVDELIYSNTKDDQTHGEKLYYKYGILGIRGEVESGFQSVVKTSYPQFVKAMNSNIGLNYSMTHSLLNLISVVEDTTILSRVGKGEHENIQYKIKKILNKGSVYTEEGKKEICKLDKYFIEKNISPGGSADLLAITVGIYILENREINTEDILKDYKSLGFNIDK